MGSLPADWTGSTGHHNSNIKTRNTKAPNKLLLTISIHIRFKQNPSKNDHGTTPQMWRNKTYWKKMPKKNAKKNCLRKMLSQWWIKIKHDNYNQKYP